jgi:hypothetical protein
MTDMRGAILKGRREAVRLLGPQGCEDRDCSISIPS